MNRLNCALVHQLGCSHVHGFVDEGRQYKDLGRLMRARGQEPLGEERQKMEELGARCTVIRMVSC